jgi:hypothetical protein
MTHTDIINRLIEKLGYESYLEIGVQDSRNNFDKIKCKFKVGVDPKPEYLSENSIILKMTSDKYYKQVISRFDIIFVDGLHESYQVYNDIKNGLEILNEGGVIVCHDMNPFSEIMQRVPREVKIWTGDCWRAWLTVKNKFKNSFVIDTDYGVGIIKPKPDEHIDTFFAWYGMCDYGVLDRNRKLLLNLKSEQEFLKWLDSQKMLSISGRR